MSEFKNIEATDYSPTILFEDAGLIRISGELRTSNPEAFFSMVNECLDQNVKIIQSKGGISTHFRFTYIGSSNALELFKFMRDLYKKGYNLIWKYDDYDDDIKELGEIIKMGHVPNLILEKLGTN